MESLKTAKGQRAKITKSNNPNIVGLIGTLTDPIPDPPTPILPGMTRTYETPIAALTPDPDHNVSDNGSTYTRPLNLRKGDEYEVVSWDNSPNPIVPVLFRMLNKSHGGDVIAVFLTLPHNTHDGTGSVTTYVHVGQHGGGDFNALIRISRPATPDEYKDLKDELEAYPYQYRLHIVKRASHVHHKARKDEINRLRNIDRELTAKGI